MTAVGVARPIAHGQAMTTHGDERRQREREPRLRAEPANQITNVAAATTSTNGTKTSLIRSARRWIGALEPCARWTIATIDARTRVAARRGSRA